MKALIVSFLLFFFVTGIEEYKWFEGSIVTTDHEVIVGKFAVAHDYETILFKREVGHEVIPAHKLVSFRFYDADKHANRKYKVIAFGKSRNMRYEFYEVVSVGKAEIIRKKHKSYHLQKEENLNKKRLASSNSQRELLDEVLDYDYFIQLEDQIIPVDKFESMVLPLLSRYQSILPTYVKENNLHRFELSDCIQIVNFYNDLEKNRIKPISLKR